MQDTTLLLGWKKICKSHAEEFEEDKTILECENCELKDYCLRKKAPFTLSENDILSLVNIIRGGI